MVGLWETTHRVALVLRAFFKTHSPSPANPSLDLDAIHYWSKKTMGKSFRWLGGSTAAADLRL